jgi:hypothetical protein
MKESQPIKPHVQQEIDCTINHPNYLLALHIGITILNLRLKYFDQLYYNDELKIQFNGLVSFLTECLNGKYPINWGEVEWFSMLDSVYASDFLDLVRPYLIEGEIELLKEQRVCPGNNSEKMMQYMVDSAINSDSGLTRLTELGLIEKYDYSQALIKY